MKKIISIIALLIVATTGISKAQDAELLAEAKKCVELQKTRETMVESTKAQYLAVAKTGQVAFDDVNALANEMVNVVIDKINEKLLAFYCENYTLEELKALNEYLSSPLGQKNIKLASKTNAISMEVQQDPTNAIFMQTIMAKHIQR